MERVDLSWGEVLGVGWSRSSGRVSREGKMGQKQYELAADYGDRLGDERGERMEALEEEDEQRAIWPPMRHL